MDENNSNKQDVENALENSSKTVGVRGRSKRNSLTPKQTEVFKLLVDGMTNKEIAEELKVSVKTIDAHRASIMVRLGIYNLPGLVKYALSNNLTTLE